MFQFNTKTNAVFFALLTFTTVQFAHAETNSIDAELNRVYQQVIKNDDIRYIAALKNAQKSWLKYRDLQCTLEADTYHVYNDNQAKNFDICINTFNQARLYFLKNQLDKLEGI